MGLRARAEATLAGLLLLHSGCVASELLSIGELDLETASSSGGMGSDSTAAGTTESGSGGATPPKLGYDGRPCEAPADCVPNDPCQVSMCVDDRCVFEFHDEWCDPGLVCTYGGCLEPLQPCEERFPDALICDDFEYGISPDWRSVSAILDLESPAQGIGALALSAESGNASMVRFRLDDPIESGMLAIRGYLRVSSASLVEQWALHYELMQLPSNSTMRMSMDLRNNNGLMVVNKISDLNAQVAQSHVPDQWQCVELRVDVADVGGYELFVDGVSIAKREDTDTRPDLGFREMGIGIKLPAMGAPPVDAWVDDVVISTAPIGCD